MGVLMPVINSMSLAQLQTTKHFLQEMEADGIRTLSEARAVVAAEEARQHAGRRRQKRDVVRPEEKQSLCPECGHATGLTVADGLLIRTCRKCRWSAPIEVTK